MKFRRLHKQGGNMIDPPLYTLGDAVELHRQHPETFALCPKEDRESLRVGNVAQLSFEIPGFKSERMWVLVVGRFRNKYIGTINNAPVQASFPVSFGDKVTFSAWHIYRLDQLWPVPKDSPFLAKEPEIARLLNEHQPTTDACAHCGEHGAEGIEHIVPVRAVTLRSITEAAFTDGMKKAWVRHDYQTVARAGAERGKLHMAGDVGKVHNEELGLAAEFYIFDKDGNFCVVATSGADSEEALSQIVSALFANKTPENTEIFKDFKPEGVLLITSATFSQACNEKLGAISDPEARKKEFQAHPCSSYPDKITMASGCVFLAPERIAAQAGIAVGTEAELAAAGFRKAQAA
jgi:hypothetical protein